MLEEEPLVAEVPVVMQVSRWDQLKDPLGVLGAFFGPCREPERRAPAAGRSVDRGGRRRPGGRLRSWTWPGQRGMSCRERSAGACTWCSLPMDDVEENASIVNALQRHANVVVQKSLAEGFGLTVAEAM